MNIDFKELSQSLSGQFQGLAGRPPGQWPLAPRVLCGLGVIAAVVVAGYFFYWSGQFEEQDTLAAQELALKEEYRTKMASAINLPALKLQKIQVDQYVERLQKQLPGKAEMAALLSDINQAGIGRGLTFDLFKPGSVVVRDYYAEQPIEIRVVGSYHRQRHGQPAAHRHAQQHDAQYQQGWRAGAGRGGQDLPLPRYG
jgi:type IV pilus assembly protein PilO